MQTGSYVIRVSKLIKTCDSNKKRLQITSFCAKIFIIRLFLNHIIIKLKPTLLIQNKYI